MQLKQKFIYIVKIGYYLSICYFTYLMILITIQYIPIDYKAAFLNLKEDAIQHDYYKIAFFSHVYTSIFVLVLGVLQFSTKLRRSFPILHKVLGKWYVFLILIIASPSGFVMAIHANGGVYSQMSFVIQSILWFVFTFKAFSCIKQKDWNGHYNFMLRSYALTLSAISLRLFKWGIVSWFAWPPMDTYQLVSWLGWGFNIIVVEIMIRLKKEASLN